MLHQVAEMTARLHDVGRQIVHVDVTAVEGDDARRGIERHQALDHVVQGGVEPAPFRFQPPLGFAALPRDLPDDQEQGQGDDRRRQRCGDDQEPGLLAPVFQRGRRRVGCHHDARVMRKRSRGSQPVGLVDRALHAQRLASAPVPDTLQQRRLGKILSDQRVDSRMACQQNAVGMKHRDCRALAEGHGSDEFLVVGRIDAPRHHAEKGAVVAAQPVGNDGIQVAREVTADLFRQHRCRSRLEFEGFEIGPLGNIESRHGQRPRPVEDVAI